MTDNEFNSIMFMLKMNEYLSMEVAFNDIEDIRVSNEIIQHYSDIKKLLYKYLEEKICKEK